MLLRSFLDASRVTNLERVTLSGYREFRLQTFSLGRLPQSITSLVVDMDYSITLLQIQNITARLPKLDNLSLAGFPAKPVGDKFHGMEAVLRRRFSGRLQLLEGYADKEVVDMLLKNPTGF